MSSGDKENAMSHQMTQEISTISDEKLSCLLSEWLADPRIKKFSKIRLDGLQEPKPWPIEFLALPQIINEYKYRVRKA